MSAGRISLILVNAAIALGAGVYGQPTLDQNQDVIRTVIMIFSILAGFLIIAMTMIVDSVLKEGIKWGQLVRIRPTLEKRLVRYTVMFLLYIVSLILALCTQFTINTDTVFVRCVQFAFVSLATFVLLASTTLPFTIIRIQRERLDLAIDRGRPETVKAALEREKKT